MAADVRIGRRSGNWPRLRKGKLFVCPEIAQAYYNGEITKVELDKESKAFEKPFRISQRISSDVCDLIPVSHEKAEAALNAYNAIRARKDLPIIQPEQGIVASVFRPVDSLPGTGLNLFSKSDRDEALIERMSGLGAATITNARRKGRLNAHTCLLLARSALVVLLQSVLNQALLAQFEEQGMMQSMLSGKPPKRGENDPSHDLSLNVAARHEIFDRFLAFVVAHGNDVESDEEREAVAFAKQSLRDFFTPDHLAHMPSIACGAKDKYLIDFEDQKPAPPDWRIWD